MASAGPIFRWQSRSLKAPRPTFSPLLPNIERREPGGITEITPMAGPTQMQFTYEDPIPTTTPEPTTTSHASTTTRRFTSSYTAPGMLSSIPTTSLKTVSIPGSTSFLDSLVIPSPARSSSAALLGGVTSIKATTVTPPIPTSTTIQSATVSSSSPAVGAIAPPGGAGSNGSSTFTPVIPTSNPIQPAKTTPTQSTLLWSPTSGSKPAVTVTEPVIVYVTKGASTPFSTCVIRHAPSGDNSSVSSAYPTVKPSVEPITTSLNFVTIHSTATSAIRVPVYPTLSLPASSSSVFASSTVSAPSVSAAPTVSENASVISVVLMTASPATPSLPSSSWLLSSPNEAAPVVTAHLTSTIVVPLTFFPTTSLPSSVSSFLTSSSEIASLATFRLTSTSVVTITVYSTTSPSDPLLQSFGETAPLETSPVVTAHITSPEIVQLTSYGSTAIRATDSTSTVDADFAPTTSTPGQGILSVNPVTPSGFITITETQTETTTVTDRITETVTATVTRD
ncbi:hypothetical protein PDIDSM_6393 [Penicillium digitatum]|nr:hypothetical protein PDIDSM_6393 [Penicillium digitatum]